MKEKETKIVAVASALEVAAYASAFAMESMEQRGKLSHEQSTELVTLTDRVYMALATGKLVSIGEGGEVLIEEPQPADGELVIGD